MTTIATVALALLLVGQEAPHVEHEERPGPRTPIGGLAGIRCRSRLDFDGTENRFEAVYVFPDRARWTFEALDRSERALFFRSGGQLYQVAGGPSEPLEGAGRDALLLQMELRRAALLWPLGFDWEASGEARHAGVRTSTCCRSRPLGELVASGPEGQPPLRIEARDLEGEVLETIEFLSWGEGPGRPLPRRLRVSGLGGSFEETIEAIDTGFRYLDQAFLPGDRRLRAAGAATGTDLLAADLVPTTFAVVELPAGLAWDQAREQAREALASARERLGPAGPTLDPIPTFELDSKARPIRCLVRLETAAESPPPGFVTQEERAGLLLSLGATTDLTGDVLERLRRAAPLDAIPAAPYVRLHAQRVELVLPLDPR